MRQLNLYLCERRFHHLISFRGNYIYAHDTIRIAALNVEFIHEIFKHKVGVCVFLRGLDALVL